MSTTSTIHTLLSKTAEDSVKIVLAQMLPSLGMQAYKVPEHHNHIFSDVIALYSDDALVLLCLDKCDEGALDAELADEESFNGESPLWFTQCSHRISPVFQAVQLTNALREDAEPPVEVSAILITGASIINYDDMVDVWKDSHITVVHQVRNIDNYNLDSTTQQAFPYEIASQPTPMADVKEEDEKEEDESDDDFDFDFFNTPDSDSLPFGNDKLAVKVFEPMKEPQKELNDLVGLDDIKKHIQQLIMLNRYNSRLLEAFPGCETHKLNLHGCFLGGVGTGKTTVARLMGALLAEAGVLSKGHVVMADRGTFIGRQFGCEEENVRKCLSLAKGGVLLIDEAYLLVGNHHEDPGQMVIQLLLNILADENQRDIAVLLCGYEKEMQRIFDLNPGITSRFPNIIRFPDYTLPQLLEIARRRIKKYQYTFTPTAWHRFATALQAKMADSPRNWANAREVANLLEAIYIQHAKRCCSASVPASGLRRITAADIPAAKSNATGRARIGFS